jgi:hypothetical protein
LIFGLENYRKLKQEDEFSFTTTESGRLDPGALLVNLIIEGPSHGLHVLVTCDTYNNASAFWGARLWVKSRCGSFSK